MKKLRLCWNLTPPSFDSLDFIGSYHKIFSKIGRWLYRFGIKCNKGGGASRAFETSDTVGERQLPEKMQVSELKQFDMSYVIQRKKVSTLKGFSRTEAPIVGKSNRFRTNCRLHFLTDEPSRTLIYKNKTSLALLVGRFEVQQQCETQKYLLMGKCF